MSDANHKLERERESVVSSLVNDSLSSSGDEQDESVPKEVTPVERNLDEILAA